MDPKKGGKEVVGLNSGVFNNTSFASFSNLQDFPFFESLASLGDLSSLAAFQSIPSIPEHLFEEAKAAAAAAASFQASQQGSASNPNLALGRNDSFANLTQSSLHNLQLFLTEVEQGVVASNQHQATSSTTTHSSASPQQQPLHQHHSHQSQQAQPLPAAAASYASPPSSLHQAPKTAHHLQALKAGPGPTPTPIAPAPASYPSPAQFAAFSSYPQAQPMQQQWGPSLVRQPSGKLPIPTSSPMTSSPTLATVPAGGPPAGVPLEFSSTLYSLASTLPPPMILSNDSVLGSVGGGLHFQRHCVRRRMPDELAQDPSMFLN